MTDRDIMIKAFEKAYPNRSFPNLNPYGASNMLKLFSHEFAKRFWGGEDMPICVACNRHHPEPADCDAGFGDKVPYWTYCLMQMVKYNNPLTYIEKFL